jgi:ferredoxin
MNRKIINIDENKCNGCGLCVPNCAEGAIQIIDGKARLISDLFCDGLGACLGHCPEGAITIEEREALPYDEKKTMENIVKGGPNTIKAHLEHMLAHNEQEYFRQAVDYLREKNIDNPILKQEMQAAKAGGCASGGCPGSAERDLSADRKPSSQTAAAPAVKAESQLDHWPVQLHLLNPNAPFFKKADVLLAADCTAYTAANFHEDFLKGKKLAIACPKLDTNRESYVQKLTAMIDGAQINTLTVMIMEVPCCGGLIQLAEAARDAASRNIPIKKIVLSIKGEILEEVWI